MFRHRRGLNLLFGGDLCVEKARTSSNSGSSPNRSVNLQFEMLMAYASCRNRIRTLFTQLFRINVVFSFRWFPKPTTESWNRRVGRARLLVRHHRRHQYRHRWRRGGQGLSKIVLIPARIVEAGWRRYLQELPHLVATQDVKVS